MKKTQLAGILSVLAICFVLIGAYYSFNSQHVSGDSLTAAYYSHVADGLAEINIPVNTADTAQNIAACDRLNAFITYRSGAPLSAANLAALKTMQGNGHPKLINDSQLVDALTTASLERLQTISSSDINSAAQTLRGYQAGDMTADQLPADYVMLRSWGDGYMTTQDFTSQVQAAQIQAQNDNSYLTSMVRSKIDREVQSRISDINAAGISTKNGISPILAMTITYAVAADDALAYNQNGLNQFMVTQQTTLAAGYHVSSYTSPSGKKAFGTNGYVYSSPVNLILTDTATARVLSLINS